MESRLIKIKFIESFKLSFYLLIVTLIVFLSSKYLFAKIIYQNIGLMEIGAIGLYVVILNSLVIINSSVDFISAVRSKSDQRDENGLVKDLSNLLYYSIATTLIVIFFWVQEKYANDYLLISLIVGVGLIILVQHYVNDKLKSRLHG